MNILCSTLFVAAGCISGAVLLAEQQFRSTTSLLTLDVSVLDRDGSPVADLKPEELIVTLNGSTQPVRAMVFLTTHSTKANATLGGGAEIDGPPSSSPSASVTSEPDPRLFVVMIDDLSIAPTESKGLLVAAEGFVEAIPRRDWVGLATTSGMAAMNPSIDRTSLLATLKGAFGRMNDPRRESQTYVGLMEALMADQSQSALREIIEKRCHLPLKVLMSKNLGQIIAEYTCASDLETQARHNAAFARQNARNQLDAFTTVIKAMAPAPGVKQLVILTGGVAVAPYDPAAFIPVAKAAAAAGVQITMMMEEPDDVDLSIPFARELASDQRRILQQVQALAEVSGGQFFRVIGQPDRFFQRVLTSASAVYRIGVDLPKELPPDGEYKVTVTVDRPGVRAFASRYATTPAGAARN